MGSSWHLRQCADTGRCRGWSSWAPLCAWRSHSQGLRFQLECSRWLGHLICCRRQHCASKWCIKSQNSLPRIKELRLFLFYESCKAWHCTLPIFGLCPTSWFFTWPWAIYNWTGERKCLKSRCRWENLSTPCHLSAITCSLVLLNLLMRICNLQYVRLVSEDCNCTSIQDRLGKPSPNGWGAVSQVLSMLLSVCACLSQKWLQKLPTSMWAIHVWMFTLFCRSGKWQKISTKMILQLLTKQLKLSIPWKLSQSQPAQLLNLFGCWPYTSQGQGSDVLLCNYKRWTEMFKSACSAVRWAEPDLHQLQNISVGS